MSEQTCPECGHSEVVERYPELGTSPLVCTRCGETFAPGLS